jgi:pilus assembly protein CpaE
MKIGRANREPQTTAVVVVTPDPALEELVRTTFAASDEIALRVLSARLAAKADELDAERAAVVVVDLDAAASEDVQALDRLRARPGFPPVVAVTAAVDADLVRVLLKMRIADFLVKPVSPAELVRTCARVVKQPMAEEPTEAQIYTFLAAVGGAGATTLAIQTAMILLNSAQRGKSSTCLVDLDFQHGACADYLDIEPRLNLGEVEPRPERLDRQLLEVMLSYHSSGLAVVAAPNQLAEMRSFDPDVVTRLLDLVSSHFDYVVFDMPRTWFSWTDSVLVGSNRLFLVSEMTVPGLRHAKQLVEAIIDRLEEGPKPQVIVNRFVQRLFSSGLRRADVEQVLGDSLGALIPNRYALVREAIDRGVPLDEVKPGNQITGELRRLLTAGTRERAAAAPASATAPGKPKLSWVAR